MPSFIQTLTQVIREKTLRFRKLHLRIIFIFSTLLFLVLLAFLYSINNIISNSTNQDIQKNLDNGQQLFKFINDESSLRLTQTASILASDFAFREAIATEDLNTMVSALFNHRVRFNASAMFLVNTENRLIADTVGLAQVKAQFPFPDLLITAENEGAATAIVLLDGHLYQMVVVPVLAPTPIGWLVSGFVIDDKFANNLKSLTGLEVSLLTRRLANKKWELRATTLPVNLSKNLANAMSGIVTDQGQKTIQIQLADNDYLSRVPVLAARPDGMVIAAVLQRSLQQALAPLHFLQKTLLILSLLSFAVALLASTWIARGITNPIRKLGVLAQRIEGGDYSQTVSIDSDDEIGQLASAVNHMSVGIADRESKIVELANMDILTKLPNRTLFLDRLGQAIQAAHRSGPQFSVMVMDLDRFKEVNDILGHHVGDLLLQEVAKRLQTILTRGSDTLARLGGDEFAILLIATDEEGAQIVANKLLKTFDESILLEGQEIIINSSLGITYYPEHGGDVNTLMSNADLAMYAAKRNNAGSVVYDASLAWQTQAHLSLMAELRNAIANNELTIYYQPKLDLATGKISDAEALIRWIHPVRGLVPPDNFIPFAEHTGFIVIITQWVVENVTRQQQEWRKLGIMLNISINISARDLLVPRLPEFFVKMLKTYDVPPQCLMLEITESSMMANPQGALSIMNELRDMGLSLSVDDFGTGYSSLAYLKKLPVSELKIDRSFVMHMENDGDDVIIVRSTIELAHNMGLTVVAEGVENQVTCDMLKAMGCDYLQGYFISRPVMAQNLLSFIEKYSK
ncbi:MAG: EAL domain-containing protein [Methylotenera sp.]|nr:EAL domain-containing protein [Methylotenera sp.]